MKKVLVIDDDVDLQDFVAYVLAGLGYLSEQMTEVDVDRLAEVNVDIIVVNIFAGQADGIEVLDILGEACGGAAVLLTSPLDNEILQSSMEYGQLMGLDIIGGLRKPIEATQFIEAVTCGRGSRSARLSVAEVEASIARNRIRVLYQPKIHLDTGRMVGVEALSRIETADTLLSPEAFLQAIESRQLGTRFSLEVIRIALSQLTSIIGSESLSLAANIDMGVLENAEFLERITELCKKFHWAPKFLTLEITERNLAATSLGSLRGALRAALRGFSLSLDDFGAGHSNYDRLNHIPFNEVKLDKDTLGDPGFDIESIKKYAKERHITLVSEGIKDQAQLVRARAMGIPLGQGFHLGRPMTIESLRGFLHAKELHSDHMAS